MSLLKRFGAMGSNSRKKTDKTGHFFKKRRRQSRFRTTLFLQPLTILVTAFAIIMLIFNGLLKLFLAEEAFRAVQSQYDILDARYVGNDSSKILDGNIFETTYAIVDEDFSIKYISASTYDLSEKQISEKVVDYFSDKTETDWFDEELDTDSQQFKKLKVYDSTYMVKMQEYSGTLGEGYVKQTNGDDGAQNYYVFVFANVTPIADFERYINYLLLSLMVIVGLVAIITIFLTSRKLDKHFGALKSYILRVGNRERDLQPENFAYREFNEVGQTVDRMNDMIDANQRSQQLFFQNSSHELRTPLMSIQGYAEAIQERVAADDKEAAAVILDESRKMAELVDDILTLSKMESTQQTLKLESFNLIDLLYDVSWHLKAKADARGISFKHDFEEDYLDIEADEKLIERAITNILSNAVRYAKKEITISSRRLTNQVEICLSNDGNPISAKDQAHLFERFYKGEGGHFGIGLAITKEIIDRHHGKIQVDSTKDRTTFVIMLPVQQNKKDL